MDAFAETLAALERAAAAASYPTSADGRVSEADAAALLGIAAGTLRNRRSGDCPLAFYRVAGRVTYRLSDLARYIEAARTEI